MATVFISHRTADLPDAERLAADLTAAGHEVWIDAREIRVGDSIVGAINDGLTGVDYVVLCYSLHGVESPWMVREWASTVASQLRDRKVRLLPVMLTGRDAPALLSDIKAADLTKDWTAGLNDLLAAIK